ncbi:MAG: copper homeostasis protein CutC [Gemmatimonadetes bacterium]|nr:copper homeostasis protein CutC [Gemmatimonadota bacterium]MBT8404354.1 copper homeostasis protein CutC [Gemmatimonadota bacterium]NNF37457.1 copper homeostasis protein CutC [Gemmatimonadota bacterium]NNK62886.1 copper homeostasis protein CutC [Gemmatimonadota bacterium]
MTEGEPSVTVEACVTSVAEARAAAEAGAGRLEVCRRLEVGGLTPSAHDLREVTEAVSVPLYAMVRPRAGDYRARAGEVERMLASIEALREAGAAGFVVGVLDGAGAVDTVALAELVDAAGPRPVTFHRAFDEVRDRGAALESLACTGVARVLTSGGAETAWDGRAELQRMVGAAPPGITILAGGRVRGDHVRDLVARTGLREVHARAAGVAGVCRALNGTG